jgi:hypothetical protein
MQATLKILLDGYRAACGRFDAARKEFDEVAGFRAIFEALEWAVSIDGVIGHRWAPEGQPLGRDWRERVPGAEAMDGLRFARTRVYHHWAAALEISRADAWYQPREFEFRWKRIEELPPAEGKRANEHGAEQYRRLMATRSADVVLSIMDEAFYDVLQFLEMPGSPVSLKAPFFEPNRSEVAAANQ